MKKLKTYWIKVNLTHLHLMKEYKQRINYKDCELFINEMIGSFVRDGEK